jgi:hypothetical protein
LYKTVARHATGSAYLQKWKPRRAYRASLADYKVDEQNDLVGIPPYAIGRIKAMHFEA